MLRSIRWRIIISYIFLTLLVVVVVGSITFQLAKNYAVNRELQGLRANAQAIALQAEPLMFSRFGNIELQQLVETSAFLGDIRVQILDTRQRAIADSGLAEKSDQIMILVPDEIGGQFPGMLLYQSDDGSSLEIPGLLTEMLPAGTTVTIVRRQDGPWGKQFTFEEVQLSDEDALDSIINKPADFHRSSASIIHPIGDPADPIGYVRLSEPVDFGSNLLDELKQALVTAGFGAVILAVIFGLWNSFRLSEPIKSLASISAQMGAGDLSVRANLNTGGEIGELGDQFNQMADSLQKTIQQLEDERDALRRFIADASHELRTPITALKNFNTLLQGPASGDPDVQREFLAESQVQIERLGWITANLLDLSRLDAGLLELDLDDHDLREIVEAAAIPFKTLAAEKRVSLVVNIPEHPVLLNVDRPRLELAIGNLLDNAIKFTPQAGSIWLSLEHGSDHVTLVVRDDGEGIPPDDLPHIFERFYRGRSHSKEGSGLGLSITKSIIEAHGGVVEVGSVLGEGTTFKLVWESTPWS